MLIRSLEQFLACAGCSSNVPYCSSPRSSSALMLLCQLLKSDKLSIFSIASQKATNSLATKLLISMVPFACWKVLSRCMTCADIPLCLRSVTLSACWAAQDPFSYPHLAAPSPPKLSVRETGHCIWGGGGGGASLPKPIPAQHFITDTSVLAAAPHLWWMCQLKLIQEWLKMGAVIIWYCPWNDLAVTRLITTRLLTRIRRHISWLIILIPDFC